MSRRTLGFLAAAVLVALVMAMGVSRYANPSPDGLETVAAEQGLADHEADHALRDGPLADYGVRGVEDEGLSTSLAGLIGVVVTASAAAGLTFALRRLGGSPTPA